MVSGAVGAMWRRIIIAALCFAALAADADSPPVQSVVFKSENVFLKGYLFKPEGSGPFPAIIWEHGSPKPLVESGSVSRFDVLARFCISHGYVLFIPDRIYRNIYFRAVEGRTGGSQTDDESVFRQGLDQLEKNHRDIVNAVEWLRAQSFVDENRVAMSGLGTGSIQTLFEAGKKLGVRAYIPFSVPSSCWGSSTSLQNLMSDSVQKADAPIFVIQAQNDSDVRATEALGKELVKKGSINTAKIYPPFGKNPKEANLFVLNGCDVWGEDVLAFLESAFKL